LLRYLNPVVEKSNDIECGPGKAQMAYPEREAHYL
jgi:hypothetical protein